MKTGLSKILHNIATDYDNRTFDTARVIGLVYFFSAICLEIYSVVFASKVFGVQDYLVGGAAFLAGLGVAIAGDNHNRPKDSTTKSDSTRSDG